MLHQNKHCANILMLTLFLCASIMALEAQRDPLVSLTIVSVRKMTDKEYKNRVTDNIGATYVVRYRVEVLSSSGAYIYAPYGVPVGYTLERKGGVIEWLNALPNKYKSPGINELIKLYSRDRWIFMSASSSREWEVESVPSRGGVEEARSVFVRASKKQESIEVISPWYIVGDLMNSLR